MAESYSVKAVLSAVDSSFTSGFRAAQSTVERLKSTLTSGIGFGVMMAAGQKAFNVVTSSVTDLIGEIDSSNSSWKTFTANMQIVGKSADEIDSVKKELQSFAEATIYNSSDMATTFAQLAAVGTKNTTKLVKGFGGLAAAAENPKQAMKTLSQQATQLAAKPMVAWQDFKLMLEQTPAGMAAVAKQMGMTATELVANVQEGTVATEAFFDAIVEVGNNDAFTKLATSYKTVGQAMDGLKQTLGNKLAPAFDVLSTVGINALSKIINKAGEIDSQGLAKKVESDVDRVSEKINSFVGKLNGYWGVAKNDVMEVKNAFGEASTAIKGSLSGVEGAFGSQDSINSFSSAINTAKDGLVSFAGFCKEHSDTIGKLISMLPQLLIAYQGFKSIGAIVPEVASFGSAILKISNIGENIGIGIIGSMENIPRGVTNIFRNVAGIVPRGVTDIARNVSERAKIVAETIKNSFSTPLGKIGKVFSAFGTTVQKSTQVGTKALGGMSKALLTVGKVALQAVGPAAIIGASLAGLGILNNMFGEQISAMLSKATTEGPAIIQQFISGINSKLPDLINSGSTMVTEILNAITANLPVILQGGVMLITTLVSGVSANIPQLLPAAINCITSFANGILSAIPILLMSGLQLLQSLSAGIVDNSGLIMSSAESVIMNFVNGIVSNLPEMISTGIQILTNLMQGAISIIPNLLIIGMQAIITIVNGISANIPMILQQGVALIGMFIQGVVQNLPQLLMTAVQCIGSFAKGVLQNLPFIITSGAQIIVSLITGLIQMLPSIASAGWELIKTLGSAIIEAIPKILTGALEGIKTIFSGVWDFITGKSSEGAATTSSTMEEMSTNTQSSMSALSASVSSSADALSANVQSSFATMGNGATGQTDTMMDSVTSSLSGMNNLGTSDMSSLSDSIISNTSTANDTASNETEKMAKNVDGAMKKITTSTKKSMDDLPKIATSSMSSLNTAISSGGNTAVATAGNMGNRIVSSFRTAQSGAYNAGYYIGIGLANGMQSTLGTVQTVAAQLANAAAAAIQTAAQIHSPSKITTDFGEYFGEGWVNGIISKVAAAKKAVKQLVFIPDIPSMGELSASLNLDQSEGNKLNGEYSYNPKIYIEQPVYLDGREISKGTAKYTREELETLERRERRKQGYK